MTFGPTIAVLFGFIGCCATARGQGSNLVINGDFENVNGSGCMSNQPNAGLGSVLPTVTGFGSGNEIDVYSGMACYGLTAFSGATKVAISTSSTGSTDAFSFGLSAPIQSGTVYALSFAAHAVMDFAPTTGTTEVGISNDPLSFGTLVFSLANPTPLVWNTYSTTFFATGSAQYLTVRSAGNHGWTHIDAFVLSAQNASEFCLGDGTGTPCPCGNDSPAGGGTGCLNSLGAGGRLRPLGNPSLSADTFVLRADQMPDGAALYLQGTLQMNGGNGVVFGDGLRCVAGPIVRLGIKINSAGASQYPQPGDLSVSVRGLVASPGLRTYQVWYRNAANFCTPLSFNLTNGIEVTWSS